MCAFNIPVCSNWTVGGWVRINPDVVRIVKIAQNNGRSLTLKLIFPITDVSILYKAITLAHHVTDCVWSLWEGVDKLMLLSVQFTQELGNNLILFLELTSF